MKKIVLIALSVFLLSDSLHSQQTATISGYIKDEQSGETLIAANVFLAETRRGVATNYSGYYRLTGVAPGEYTLVVSYIGYKTHRQKVKVSSGQGRRIDVELESDFLYSEELVVEAEKTIAEEKPIGLSTVPQKLIQELPAVLQADLFRSIQLLPGIKSASDFSSGLYIRGGSPDQTLILLDRTTVYNPSHFFGFFSTFNPDAIKDVRIYKGGYPAEYGGRLGSVIDIYNRDGNRKEFQGRTSLGLLSSRLNLEGPVSNGSWMLAMRRSTLEPLLAALRDRYDDVPDAFHFIDLNGKLNYDATPNDKINLAFYSGTDVVEFPFADDAEFNLNYGNRTVSANWTHLFSKKTFSAFTATYSHYFSNPDLVIGGTEFARENTVTDVSVKGDVDYILDEKNQFKAGFWAGGLDLTIRESFDQQQTFEQLIDASYVSAYAEYTWKPTVRWIAKGGVRGSFFSAGDYFRAEPRLSLENVFTDRVLFQAAYGRYYQFLTLITNEAFTGFDTWLTTDVGVPPAWGDQFVLGMKTRPKDGYVFDVELYYRTMRDLFELNPRLQDVAGLEYVDFFRFGEGYAYGAEFFLEKRRGRLNGFIGYTWGTSRREFPGYNNDEPYPPKHDRIHDTNIVMNFDLSKKWRATGVFNYATGQAYTEGLGS